MEAPVEFYLATLWKYHPVAVRRMMDQLTSGTALFEGVELMYDAEYHWVKVNCSREHQPLIRRLFNQITAEIENEVFDNHSEILNDDGTLKSSFDTSLIIYDDASYDSSLNYYSLEPYTFPASFAEAKYAHTAAWNNLEYENLAIHQLVDPDEFDKLKSDADVAMEYNSSGKLVYIGSHHYEGIQKAKAKLDVLLAIRKLPPARPQHLLYIEDHAEILRVESTADIRYMFNIDPRLPSSTLIDPAVVGNLERAYQKMHEEGASIRLCIYDASRGRHFSIYGPKIKGRGGMKYPLGNRPNNFFKANESAAPSPTRSTTQAEKDAFIKVTKPAPSPTRPNIQSDKEAQVSKWIDEIPTHGTMAPLENDSQLSASATEERGIRSSSNTGSSDKIIDNVRLIASDPGVPEDQNEQLRTLVHEPVKNVDRANSPLSQSSPKNQEGRPYLSGSSSPLPFDEVVKQAIDEDRPIPVKKPGLAQMPKKTGPGDAKEDVKGGANPPFQAPGALDTKPHQPPLTWSMAPLVPVPVHTTVGTEPSTRPAEEAKTDNDENESPFQRYHEPGARGFSTMDQQGMNARKMVTSASTVHKNIGTRLQDLSLQHPLTQDFPKELHPAIRRLLVGCPYMRGTITVRADFGRIILGGMDQSAMAFNNAKTPSNGWKKADLLKNLNEQVLTRDRIHFTKILSTYGSDLEDMINMTDETGDQTNNRLWQPVPRESWVVYSFRCIYRENGAELFFLINCRYAPDGKDYTYEIRPFNSTNDGVTPIYVHDLLRSWDLRITLTHIDSPIFEQVLGRATRKFLKSVKISQVTSFSSVDSDETIRVTKKANHDSSKFEAEGIDLQFSLADDRLYVQEVRVLTKWRYSNFKTTSELEITEVVPLVTTPVPGRKIRTYLSQLPSKKDNRVRLSKGVYPRWYEASVVSTALEKVFKENEKLPFAEKTSWSIETPENFEGHNALCAIYEPALQMLKQMDPVGGNECNNMPQDPQYEVRRRNDKQEVPGLTQPTPVTSPPPGGPRQGGHDRLGSSASARGPSSVARARWDARMEDVKKKGGSFW